MRITINVTIPRTTAAPKAINDLHADIASVAGFLRIQHGQQPPPSFKGADVFQSHLGHDEVFRQNVDDQGEQYEAHQNKEQEHPAQDEWKQVLPRILDPTRAQSKSSRNSNQDGESDSHR